MRHHDTFKHQVELARPDKRRVREIAETATAGDVETLFGGMEITFADLWKQMGTEERVMLLNQAFDIRVKRPNQ